MRSPASFGHSVALILEPADPQRLADFCGPLDAHLRQLEQSLKVQIVCRGNAVQISGEPSQTNTASVAMHKLYAETKDQTITPEHIHLVVHQASESAESGYPARTKKASADKILSLRRGQVCARSRNQADYLHNLDTHDLNFGIGPAGTGKTYLAVACAVAALESYRVQRLVLVRPAVEAGERLGFLPGDLAQKVDPYLRPLFDALYEMVGFEKVSKLIETNRIEIAPLAYMRGRTLKDSFIILDEAQNTSIGQMMMFLTRIGFGSIAVVTGDVTQVDLPSDIRSGLEHAIEVLRDTDGISFTRFDSRDVVRHPLVISILGAYQEHQVNDTTPNER